MAEVDSFIGRTVRKHFPGYGEHEGVVESVDSDDDYVVTWKDG